MSSSSFLRRLEQLERAIRLKQPRQIFILVDGNAEDQLAADTLIQAQAPSADDLVVCIRHFGGDDRDLPRVLNVSALG
jgi:hypothetical protein